MLDKMRKSVDLLGSGKGDPRSQKKDYFHENKIISPFVFKPSLIVGSFVWYTASVELEKEKSVREREIFLKKFFSGY